MRARPLAAIAATTIVVGACGGNAGPGDFADEAEKYIEGELADDNPQVTGIPFTDANCDEPASTDVGTTYTCTAVGADGQTYSFPVSIDAERTLTVQQPTLIASGATTTTSTTASTTTTAAG